MSPDKDAGLAYAGLLDELFPEESAAQRRVRKATCLLADIGAYFHPDLRGEQAFDTALRAPFYAVTHPERAAIAHALYCRHEGARTPPDAEAIVAMMNEAERRRATEIGVALRFGASVAPKAPQAIRRCSLTRSRQKLFFTAPSDMRPLFDDTPRKRLDALAESVGLAAVVQFDS